ncbi:MAG: DUF1330 domain-containing protein [Burkholderiales bacterium]
MPKAYIVTTYKSIKNPDKLAAYAKLAGPAMIAAGGTFLVRGVPVQTYENGQKQRTVVIEFASMSQALAAYTSPGYQEALRALGEGNVDRDMRVVEGAE